MSTIGYLGRHIRLNPEDDLGRSDRLFADALDCGADGCNLPRGPTWRVSYEGHLTDDYRRFGVGPRQDESSDRELDSGDRERRLRCVTSRRRLMVPLILVHSSPPVPAGSSQRVASSRAWAFLDDGRGFDASDSFLLLGRQERTAVQGR
jgi:hypothetical protein